MSDDQLDPLPPELAALLAQTRHREAPSPEATSRVWERLHAEMGVDAPPEGGPPPAAPPPPAPSPPPAPLVPPAASSAGTSGAASGLVRGLALFTLGSVVGATGHAVYRDQRDEPRAPVAASVASSAVLLAPPPVAPVAPVVAPSTSVATAVSPSEPTSVLPTGSARPSAPIPQASASASGRDESLAAERAVLEMARSALARGQASAALSATDRHRSEFPRGRLSEEREALAVQALAASGRADLARARLAQFRRSFPRSMMLPALEALLP